jgi:hypothetical protein
MGDVAAAGNPSNSAPAAKLRPLLRAGARLRRMIAQGSRRGNRGVVPWCRHVEGANE